MTKLHTKISCYVAPGGVSDPNVALGEARVAENIGLSAVWLGERIDTKDFPSVVGALSQITSRIKLGVGVTPANLRHPMILASAGQTLQALAEGRFRMGFGKSAAWRWTNYGYQAPSIASMRDVALILKRLWAGETVQYEGPAGVFPNMKLAQRIVLPPPPLYLAAVGEKTLAMAGEVFDGVILHPFLTPEAVRKSVLIIRNRADKAGRNPDAIDVVATVVSAPEMSRSAADHAIRARCAGYLQVKGLGEAMVKVNGWDLKTLENYHNHPRFQSMTGYTADKTLTREELIEVSHALPDEWFESASVSGSNEECVERLKDYAAAGINEILIHGATADHLGGIAKAMGFS